MLLQCTDKICLCFSISLALPVIHPTTHETIGAVRCCGGMFEPLQVALIIGMCEVGASGFFEAELSAFFSRVVHLVEVVAVKVASGGHS